MTSWTNITSPITLNPTSATSYTIGANGSSNLDWSNLTVSSTAYATSSPSGKISLRGPDADVDINGTSLKQVLSDIQERLNVLTVNHELEGEWEELRQLGEQYRKLEKDILEKMDMWKKLNAKESR